MSVRGRSMSESDLFHKIETVLFDGDTRNFKIMIYGELRSGQLLARTTTKDSQGGQKAQDTHEMETQEPQGPHGPPAWTLGSFRSHGPVASSAWLMEPYIAQNDGYIDTGLAEQHGLAVGDVFVGATDPISSKEALTGEDGSRKTVRCREVKWSIRRCVGQHRRWFF